MFDLDQSRDSGTLGSESNSSSHIPSAYYSTRTSLGHEDFTNESHNEYNDSLSLNRLAAKDRKIMERDETEETMLDGSCNDLGKAIHKDSRLYSYYDAASSLYFRDGIRPIDFVLVWDEFNQEATSYRCVEMRKTFEVNLEKEGLQLEYECDQLSGLCFIKITTTKEVLRRYSEILKLRMPMREVPGLRIHPGRQLTILEEVNSFFRGLMDHFYVDPTIFPPMKHKFTAVYSRDKEYLFDINSPDFFTQATRSRIVQFILDRTRFTLDIEDDFAFGIDRLITEKAYSAAYPLHDGNLKSPDSMRYLLYTEWAGLRKMFHYQPLDYVKEYFGVKIGLYFAWLGFYTHMLLPASIVGLICFGYSIMTLDDNEMSREICESNHTMCSLCDNFCSTWSLSDTCFHSKITYLFDNPSTVFFAVFMSLWATLFLELWKNYSAEITHRWDLTSLDIHEEHPRPKYLARLAHVKKKSVNFVTNAAEPRVPFWKVRLPATIFSCSVILLLITVAMAAVLGVVLYRMSVLTAFYSISDKKHNKMVTSYAIILTTATAAGINLCCIVVFNLLYVWIAEYLTEVELPRTQTEFDDSLTLKIYLLEFVNYYASIFYIAFFKGKFVGYPGKYNRFFNSRQEECGPGGCFLELCIQLGIIMIGKQAVNSILEMLFPLFRRWLNTVRVQVGLQKSRPSEKNLARMHLQWVHDYKLVEWGPRSLFPEYLEMILQYGFVTIFVAAFPLAPFFALVNNVLEMRLDAKKLLIMYRRPVSQRVRDIGVWYKILDSVSKLSVITNAFIIAFTSNFIPRLVYRIAVSEDHTISGFVENSLSKFNTSDDPDHYNESMICRYPDYREPPDSPDKYQYNLLFWHILAARFAFVVVFEVTISIYVAGIFRHDSNIVAMVIIIVRWCIPDMSSKLKDKIRREAYITNEIIIQHEAFRACQAPSVEEPITQTRVSDRESTDRWNRVLRNSLTTFDFDLEVHGSPMSPAPNQPKTGPVEL